MPPLNVMLITGARKGIGRHLAEYYLDQGFVVVGCSRTESDVLHERYHHACLDVADERAVIQLVSDIQKKHKQLDVLINNAGVASMNHALLTTYDSAEKMLHTNVLGSFLFCREAAKLMQVHRRGSIINVTSVAVPFQLAGEALYAASKAAVEHLTCTLAKEFGPLGIRVNAVGPTPVETDLIRSVPKEKIDHLLAKQVIGRLGTYQDVRKTVDFFVDDQSAFVTGQILYLGGVT